jgi:DNA (cytosine-5)-methyltransferase 1
MARKKAKRKLTVIDFFCGGGGFSEGFRQQGFDVIMGIDHWQPAIDTFNYNFKKDLKVKNMLEFSHSIDEIEALPDTQVIIGSPPCVSFSNSNRSGKADKSMGLQLTEAFLRIVAIKKHKRNSKLKAWFMENVVNSRKYLKPHYTFKDLKLQDWAIDNGYAPTDIAISLLDNSTIINSADYGSLQLRKRVISGEILRYKKLIIPKPTHKEPSGDEELPCYRTISIIKNSFPSPYDKWSEELMTDPIYGIKIKKSLLMDHFYDTGIYECDWANSEYLKQNHPFMGKMSFPENSDRPSRTITATRIVNSREAIIYKTELDRKGDGEYRIPTVREIATIMGFPITYQFIGSEYTKWRLIGNAVCTSVSSALANEVLKALGRQIPREKTISKEFDVSTVTNINTYSIRKFEKAADKNKGARFRRHPLKEGGMTVALSNYDIIKNTKKAGKWRVTAFYGTGEGFGVSKYTEGFYKTLEPLISTLDNGQEFIKVINNGFSEKIAGKKELQNMYETRMSIEGFLEPTKLIDHVAVLVNKFAKTGQTYEQKGDRVFKKDVVPVRQLFALYALNKISSVANLK